jgi:hypothetical protein
VRVALGEGVDWEVSMASNEQRLTQRNLL